MTTNENKIRILVVAAEMVLKSLKNDVPSPDVTEKAIVFSILEQAIKIAKEPQDDQE